MQRRQLDGYARIQAVVVAPGLSLERSNRLSVGLEIALRVRAGARGLAKHVIGVGVPLGGLVPPSPQRLADSAAEYELFAHFAHRSGNGRSDDGLAETADHG